MPHLSFPSLSVKTLLVSCALAASLATTACSGNGGGTGGSGGSGGSGGGSGGGPVSGPADSHCGSAVTKVDPASCMGAGGTGGGTGTTTTTDTGTTGTATDTGGDDYGATLYNAEGDDDDCKYHVKFTSTGIAENSDVTFTITVTNKSDGSPVTGAAPDVEAYLSDIHPAPNTDQHPTEKGKGVYDIGPIKFDAAGKWTVRFHLFESCNDGETSPHGHVAFYVAVP